MVNFYLVRGPGGLLALDAGSNAAMAAREMKRLGIDPLEVKAVLLTHSDYDHIAALPLFRNAVLYLSRDEVRMIDGSTDRMLFLKNKIGSAYKTLADGQELEAAGLKVKCLASPGHTPGSMCYLVDQAWLFTGDTIALNEGRAGTFIKFFNMDGEAQRKAIPKLAGLSGVRAVFTAHHGMSEDYARVFAGWKN
jgi:glyoxylase-like metal-dependent hydrolase (beta-lactamase superfamily II)